MTDRNSFNSVLTMFRSQWKDAELLGSVDIQIQFKCAADLEINWAARLYADEKLLVEVPLGSMPDGTREG